MCKLSYDLLILVQKKYTKPSPAIHLRPSGIPFDFRVAAPSFFRYPDRKPAESKVIRNAKRQAAHPFWGAQPVFLLAHFTAGPFTLFNL